MLCSLFFRYDNAFLALGLSTGIAARSGFSTNCDMLVSSSTGVKKFRAIRSKESQVVA